jgi:hypothetical protein
VERHQGQVELPGGEQRLVELGDPTNARSCSGGRPIAIGECVTIAIVLLV